MLEKIDLAKKLSKQEYKAAMDGLEARLGELQRAARASGVPLLIVIEGWDAAGKGTLINNLMLALDPRGFKVHPTNAPTEEERLRPWLWRFWIRTPGKGGIAIFDRSWYGKVLVERVDRIVSKAAWLRAYEEINSFERQLADDGVVIAKFLLHIGKKEQKKRFRKLLDNKATAWKVTKDDRKHHRQYDKYLLSFEDMLEKTGTEWAPWTIIEAHDRRFATVKAFDTLLQALERKLDSLGTPRKTAQGTRRKSTQSGDKLAASILDKVDLSRTLSRDKYEKERKKYQKRILELEHEVFLRRVPVVVMYEGWDAAGKGGNIKRLVQGMDPRGYEVIPFAAPTDVEKRQHYLWRFWREIPKAGHIAIFDRSWYGRVLVERVEGFCTPEEWRRAYREINEMEEQWTGFGMVLVKFWMHIDQDEQLRRFKARKQTPHKQWKITDEDWRNREKWGMYRSAVDEMVLRTSTRHAPWTIVEANSKLHGRIRALRTVVERLEDALG